MVEAVTVSPNFDVPETTIFPETSRAIPVPGVLLIPTMPARIATVGVVKLFEPAESDGVNVSPDESMSFDDIFQFLTEFELKNWRIPDPFPVGAPPSDIEAPLSAI
jgi:hypothetical protein